MERKIGRDSVRLGTVFLGECAPWSAWIASFSLELLTHSSFLVSSHSLLLLLLLLFFSSSLPLQGSAVCTDCQPGTFQPSPGMTNCSDCEPGTEAPLNGERACSPCNDGYVAPEEGTPSCQLCPVSFSSLLFFSLFPPLSFPLSCHLLCVLSLNPFPFIFLSSFSSFSGWLHQLPPSHRLQRLPAWPVLPSRPQPAVSRLRGLHPRPLPVIARAENLLALSIRLIRRASWYSRVHQLRVRQVPGARGIGQQQGLQAVPGKLLLPG